MITPLKEYAKRIPNFGDLSRQPARLVPYLAHYLDEENAGAIAAPKTLASMFEELRVRPPANISDVIRKSNLFVRARSGGYRLSHEGQQKVIAALLPKSEAAPDEKSTATLITENRADVAPDSEETPSRARNGSRFSKRNVLVVYGRNQSLRLDLFTLLRALGLNPLEFEEMAQMTGSASPYTLEVLETAFQNVQACVVLLSPDEIVSLRPELREQDDPDGSEFQPRPNVLIEAGMAMALQPKRTILVRVGNVRSFSDFDGKQYVNLTGSAESRNKLRGKLQVAECDVKSHGNDWLRVGNFNVS